MAIGRTNDTPSKYATGMINNLHVLCTFSLASTWLYLSIPTFPSYQTLVVESYFVRLEKCDFKLQVRHVHFSLPQQYLDQEK